MHHTAVMQPGQQSSEEFLEAYDTYADAIYRHCYYRVSQQEVAEDLMQDTFMRTWDYLCQGKKVENMRAFLYRIANNLVVNHYKRKKSVSLDELQEQGFDPAAGAPSGPFGPASVAKYLAMVDPESRDLLVMRFVDEMGPLEIAGILGLSENVVSVRLHRALKKLRSLLHDDEQD